METILTIFFNFIGGSIASGITWDLIKSAKKGLVESFKKRFVSKKDFGDDSDAEEFLQYILEKKVANKDDAEKSAKSWYEKRTGQQDSQDFINDLTNWLKENQKQFSDLSMTNVQAGIINTGTQTITGNVTTTNTNTTNYYGNPSNDTQDEQKKNF